MIELLTLTRKRPLVANISKMNLRVVKDKEKIKTKKTLYKMTDRQTDQIFDAHL